MKEIAEDDKTVEFKLKYGGEFTSVKTFEILWKAKEDLPLKISVLLAVKKLNITNKAS